MQQRAKTYMASMAAAPDIFSNGRAADSMIGEGEGTIRSVWVDQSLDRESIDCPERDRKENEMEKERRARDNSGKRGYLGGDKGEGGYLGGLIFISTGQCNLRRTLEPGRRQKKCRPPEPMRRGRCRIRPTEHGTTCSLSFPGFRPTRSGTASPVVMADAPPMLLSDRL